MSVSAEHVLLSFLHKRYANRFNKAGASGVCNIDRNPETLGDLPTWAHDITRHTILVENYWGDPGFALLILSQLQPLLMRITSRLPQNRAWSITRRLVCTDEAFANTPTRGCDLTMEGHRTW